MENLALLLTSYEKFGCVDMDEFIEMYIDEELIVDENMVSDYNEYLADNCYETFFDDYDFDAMLSECTPSDIARMVTFGNFDFNADYHRFDGYGNIESFNTNEIINEMESDRDFLRWYVDNSGIIDDFEFDPDEIIEMANELLERGF